MGKKKNMDEIMSRNQVKGERKIYQRKLKTKKQQYRRWACGIKNRKKIKKRE